MNCFPLLFEVPTPPGTNENTSVHSPWLSPAPHDAPPNLYGIFVNHDGNTCPSSYRLQHWQMNTNQTNWNTNSGAAWGATAQGQKQEQDMRGHRPMHWPPHGQAEMYTKKTLKKQNNKTVCCLCDNQLCWPRTDMGISTRVLMQQQGDNQS